MSDHLLYDVADRIAHIRINRPAAMNAISPPLMADLSALLKHADDDDDNVSVIVLSGEGGHFGAGYDLKYPWGDDYGSDVIERRRMLIDCVGFELTPWNCTKPVIAMVRGYCLAGSCELAMMCCITFAGAGANFGEPEIRFSGAPPAVIMPWIVGLKKARELLYTGDIIDADEALRIGMVNRVFADENLEAETFRYARRAAAISLEGLRTTKASINRGAEIAGIRQALDIGIDQGAMLDATLTEDRKAFNHLRDAEGLTAALRWNKSRFT